MKGIKGEQTDAAKTKDGEALPVEARLVALLRKLDLKVATAESLTGGMIAMRLTSVPGASAVFKEGFVTYSNKAKRRTLAVKKELLKRCGAISEECARAMALGGLMAAEADVSIAVTGNAGPEAAENKPVGLVYLACCCKGKVQVEAHQFEGDRETVRRQTAERALELLLERVQEKYA